MRIALTICTSIGVAGTLLLSAGCGGGPSASTSALRSAPAAIGPESGRVAYQITPTQTASVQPGIHPDVIFGTLHNPDSGNVAAAQAGRQLFVEYNCSGCHGGRAGGGMGPSLRDEYWTYGNSDTQLYGTIVEGRSAGMPAWGGRIPPQQIWQLITYIRTLATPAEPDPPPPQDHPPMPGT